MKIVVQRAKNAQVRAKGNVVGAIDFGYVLLVGVTHDDHDADVQFLADKVANLRIFEGENEKMNHSLIDVKGSVLSISQFTLYGDARKGRRPNFMNAAKPDHAKKIYDRFNEMLTEKGIHVETGIFGEMMEVELTNDGPVTLILESKE